MLKLISKLNGTAPQYFIVSNTSLNFAIFATGFTIKSNTMEDKKATIIDLSAMAAKEDNNEVLIPYRKGMAWGYCNEKKEEVIDYVYESADPFSEGLAVVRMEEKCGYIDKNDKLVIPYRYDYALPFKEGLAPVEKKDRYGYINKSGNEVIPFRFNDAENFIDGLAIVEIRDKWGFIDKQGDVVIPCKFDMVAPFIDGVAFVELNGETKFIDKTGKFVDAPGDDVYYDGLTMDISEDGEKVGFKDRDGKQVVPQIYDAAMDFSEGMAAVCIDGKWGYINTEGTLVVPCIYDDYIDDFCDGLVLVELKDDFGYIDKNGVQYWED
ncbi:MAG: WG repeat-containing protein [Taibaiella sp.]|nr:WG repeat-containing protein [Taibaiella sp.]